MTNVIKKSTDILKKERRNYIYSSLTLFFTSTIIIVLLLIFENRDIKLFVEIFGSILGFASYFISLFIFIFLRGKVNSLIKDSELSNTNLSGKELKLKRISEQSFFMSYNTYKTLTFVENNKEIELIVLESEVSNFTINGTYKIYYFGDKILKYEEN